MKKQYNYVGTVIYMHLCAAGNLQLLYGTQSLSLMLLALS